MARSMVSTSGARQGHFSPTVAQVFAIDAEPSAKARMLREWYRALAALSANPAIWESRLLTAEELDAAAGRIEP